jgi:endonuclease/exonuclease/phosphatase family metal-dependent hydrolase
MNKVPVIIFLLLFLGINSIQAQSRDRLRIMTYNVENLFDTLHAVGKSDTEFTPQGERHWNAHHYWRKLVRIGSVIAAAGGSSPVDIVALAEVENDSVLYDLTKRTKLHKIGYEFIITHANDARGINVALMYLPYRFRPFVKDTLRIAPPAGHKPRQTRDVLHVAGQVTNGDTLDVIVCHLPSQRGGRPAQHYRLNVARAMRHLVDSLAAMRQHPQIVITGDFNTSYPSAVFDEGLHVCLLHTASAHVANTNQLYLLTHNMKGRNDVAGTYK